MKKKEIYKKGDEIVRILNVDGERCLCIDCSGRAMPLWKPIKAFSEYSMLADEDLYTMLEFEVIETTAISHARSKVMHERYSLIAPILPFVGDKGTRDKVIGVITADNKVSKQTIRAYLKRYLIFQHMQALLPKEREYDIALTKDQKNMRWSLNKFFYNFEKNSLRTAYVKMLKEKYCDEAGQLMDTYPSFYQYRYFYRKTRKLENYYISRNGLTNYQRNDRPCLGDNVRVYASAPGLGMVDATVCDIYLVNESGQVVGRPMLTAMVDAFSGICMGYSLSWEGGIYSVRDMMLNVISDKVAHCKRYGIEITEEDWPVEVLPGRMLSDQGSEYMGYNLEQIAELGIVLENVQAWRPDLKGPVEKFFDVIQNLYKKNLKGKGVVEPDYLERGAHDYRKDACLKLNDFEKILIRCIIHYNTSNVLEDYPFTEDMVENRIKPYPNAIWQYGLGQVGANLMKVDKERLTLCLLPRTLGKFTRYGLVVNKLRYINTAFKERYLIGGECIVAYEPNSTNFVWLIEKGEYTRFELIESRFKNKTFDLVSDEQRKAKDLVSAEEKNNLQAEIDLSNHIQQIAEISSIKSDGAIKDIKGNRDVEKRKTHKNHTKEAGLYEY